MVPCFLIPTVDLAVDDRTNSGSDARFYFWLKIELLMGLANAFLFGYVGGGTGFFGGTNGATGLFLWVIGTCC